MSRKTASRRTSDVNLAMPALNQVQVDVVEGTDEVILHLSHNVIGFLEYEYRTGRGRPSGRGNGGAAPR